MADGSLFYLFDMRYISFLDLLFNPILFALSCLFFRFAEEDDKNE